MTDGIGKQWVNDPAVIVAAAVDRSDVATSMADRLVCRGVLQDWLIQFLVKNRKYRALDGNSLGAKGVFVDVHRKFGVLKSRLWDGDSTVGSAEPTIEIVDDLIGHLFLIRDFLVQEGDSDETG